MDSILQAVQAQNSDLDPIVILAPTQRCGTTLIQRSINAGGEAVIVGENFYLMEKYAKDVALCFNAEVEKRRIVEATKQEFLAGNTGIDGSALFLDYEGYLRKVAGDFYSLIRHYKDAAARHGRRAWGIKHQTRSASDTLTFLRLVPKARVLFMTRHVFDTAASFRGRWPHLIDTPQKVALFGRTWALGMEIKEKLKNPLLFIRYEDMMGDKEGYRKKIEEFLKVPLNKEQFDIRVNAHVESGNRNDLKKGGVYIKPAPLTQREKEILVKESGEMLKRLGYPAAA